MDDGEDRDITLLEEEKQVPTGDPSGEDSLTPMLESHEKMEDKTVYKNGEIWEGETMGGATGDINFGEAAVTDPSGKGKHRFVCMLDHLPSSQNSPRFQDPNSSQTL